MLAAVSGHLSTVSALLEAGAEEAAPAPPPAPARPRAKPARAAAAGPALRSPKAGRKGSAAAAAAVAGETPPQPRSHSSHLDPIAMSTLIASTHGNNSVLRLLLDRGVALDTQMPNVGQSLPVYPRSSV